MEVFVDSVLAFLSTLTWTRRSRGKRERYVVLNLVHSNISIFIALFRSTGSYLDQLSGVNLKLFILKSLFSVSCPL